MDFDLRQLEIFCKVVELGSFSKAAEAVDLAQASVSERVATLEQIVGVKLLDRIGRVVVPSRAGSLLYERALTHLALKRETCQAIEEFLGVQKGEIAIGGSTVPGEYLLPGVIKNFQERHPHIVARLRIGDSDDISRRVAEGTLEVGVVGSKGCEAGIVYKELWQDALVLIVPPAHHLANKKSVSIDALLEEPFIQRETGSGTRAMVAHQLKKRHVAGLDAWRTVAELGSPTAVKEGVKQGLGIAIISSRAVEADVRAGTLRVVPVAELDIRRSFYLIRDRRRSCSPICRAFMDFIHAERSQF